MENKKRTYIKSEIKVYPMANDNLLQAAVVMQDQSDMVAKVEMPNVILL